MSDNEAIFASFLNYKIQDLY